MGCKYGVANDSAQMEILEPVSWEDEAGIFLSHRLAWNTKAFMDTPSSCLYYHGRWTEFALSMARRQDLL